MHAPGLYHSNWPSFTRWLKQTRAKFQCECIGQCGLHKGIRCREIHATPGHHMRGRVTLAGAHLCKCYPRCVNPGHVIAACQACHLRIDGPQHTATRRRAHAARSPFDPESTQPPPNLPRR
jgi:hypothetical protein